MVHEVTAGRVRVLDRFCSNVSIFFNVPIPVLVTHSSFSFYIVTSKLSPFSDCCAGQVIEGQAQRVHNLTIMNKKGAGLPLLECPRKKSLSQSEIG